MARPLQLTQFARTFAKWRIAKDMQKDSQSPLNVDSGVGA